MYSKKYMGGASSIAERTRKTCVQQARFANIPESPAFRHEEYVKDQYIEQIKELVVRCMSEEPVHVFLFGSWARGTAGHGSDVDVAIEYIAEPSNVVKISELRELLEESTIPYRVDVVDMQRASEGLIQEIRKDGIPWK